MANFRILTNDADVTNKLNKMKGCSGLFDLVHSTYVVVRVKTSVSFCYIIIIIRRLLLLI